MRYRSVPGVVITSICGRNYLVASEKTIEINDTAAFYWEQLKDGADENELFEKTSNEFEIDDEQMIRNEIHELIRYLSENRLIAGMTYE